MNFHQCSVIGLNTLMNLLLHFPDTMMWSFISLCYSWWQPQMNIFKKSQLASSQSFHKYTNYHLAHIVTTLKCYYTVHVTTKIISYSAALLLCNLSKTVTTLNMSQYYHFSKDKENQVTVNKGSFMLFISNHLFQCCQHHT